ncbi:hypothetical protein Tco_1386466 [Tanacetum coccineum]
MRVRGEEREVWDGVRKRRGGNGKSKPEKCGLSHDNTKPPLSTDTFGNNGGDDSESGPVTPVEQVVGNGHSSTLLSLVEHRSPHSLQLWERIGIGDVHGFINNEGNHNFVQPNAEERMRDNIK